MLVARRRCRCTAVVAVIISCPLRHEPSIGRHAGCLPWPSGRQSGRQQLQLISQLLLLLLLLLQNSMQWDSEVPAHDHIPMYYNGGFKSIITLRDAPKNSFSSARFSSAQLSSRYSCEQADCS